ncbi:MAG TPA: RNA polymerase sigma factor [Candidatus Paceibacterota bacterium]|jgi:RNA polymerase sigma-70 factor (ECF subfamily)|nr:RNA polymerase sigma factor [Candidatus Paceibacterota bacterium]
MERTDIELMEASKRGDARSFDELVSRYIDRIYGFALRFSGSADIATDAAQETFIKVWKNRKRYRAGRNVSPWIFTIARNATLDVLRKRKDLSFSSVQLKDAEDMAEALPDESVDIPASFDWAVLARVLDETLEELTPDQRAIVILHDKEGMTFDEAGEAIGKPLNTVKSHYRRAIIALRNKLEDRGYRGP